MSCGTAQGSIVCECGSWSWPQRRQCVINRMRRLHAQAIAGAPDNPTRKTIINALAEHERPPIRATAWQMIKGVPPERPRVIAETKAPRVYAA